MKENKKKKKKNLCTVLNELDAVMIFCFLKLVKA